MQGRTETINNNDIVGYDLIGDVHGCYKTLVHLLEVMGYGLVDGCYRYLDTEHRRQVIFLGDLIDRGPGIREVLHLVKAMVDAGSAVALMGNHEYHAVLYLTADNKGGYLRRHTQHSHRIIEQTLRQFEGHSEELLMFRDWMAALPLFYENATFRAVHAYWDDERIANLRRLQKSEKLSHDHLIESAVHHRGTLGRLVQRLTTGLTLKLPDDKHIVGREGQKRKRFRIRFWGGNQSHGEAAFQPDPLPSDVEKMPLEDTTRDWLLQRNYAGHRRPLFIGHYWLQGEPKLQSPNIACLDYSAVLGGRLAAYRMDGEQELDDAKFVSVACRD